MIKLNDDPNAKPMPRNAAIIDDAISLSWLLTDLKKNKKKKTFSLTKQLYRICIVELNKTVELTLAPKSWQYLLNNHL